MNKRNSGVLMPVTMLPNEYGIGGFGRECFNFLDLLKEMDFGIWQVLPFHPVDEAYSPYKSESAFAGNLLFIDPDTLYESGLVTKIEIDECKYYGSPDKVNYDFVLEKKTALLRKAFTRNKNEEIINIEDFRNNNRQIVDYAVFKTIKQKHNGAPWWEWEEKYRNYNEALNNIDELKDEIDFYIFVQFIFFNQWSKVKSYANSLGIKILGDIPIYVDMDSSDLWGNIEYFRINEETFVPDAVAGVPPDYFSEDGQLWGNPLYDWNEMKKDNYKWWMERIRSELRLFDMLRIDHFRGLASYWAVPYGSTTARNGQWEKGPGMRFIDTIKKSFPNAEIVAEDLGAFGDDVKELLRDSGFPGMRVIQFAFDGGSGNPHLPHNYDANLIVCPGNHDNNTLIGWLSEQSNDKKRYIADYCGYENFDENSEECNIILCRKIIEAIWSSSAALAIVPCQDMCFLGGDSRINTPGTKGINWISRITSKNIEEIDRDYYFKINEMFGRRNY